MDDNLFILKKLETAVFKDYIEELKADLSDKKVLIYGAGWAFEELNKKIDFKKFNVVAISDLKFTEVGEFSGFKSIPPNLIKESDFDVMLMTLFYPDIALKSLIETGQVDVNTEIEHVLKDQIPQELEFMSYLDKIKFQKHLDRLSRKLKDKKVVIYGAGAFFQTIDLYFDLSDLNIVAISDRKFLQHEKDEKYLNYEVCAPNEIEDYNPDYVLVATRFLINIIEDLEENVIKDKKIKILPLVRKPFLELFKEIWS